MFSCGPFISFFLFFFLFCSNLENRRSMLHTVWKKIIERRQKPSKTVIPVGSPRLWNLYLQICWCMVARAWLEGQVIAWAGGDRESLRLWNIVLERQKFLETEVWSQLQGGGGGTERYREEEKKNAKALRGIKGIRSSRKTMSKTNVNNVFG